MKKFVIFFLIFGIVLSSAPSLWARSTSKSIHQARSITAKSILVVDRESGKVLLAKSSHEKRAPASTIKLLTTLVVIDELPLDRVVVVSPAVVGTQPSRINLRGGERFYVRDLLRAVLINSANDAARALAIATAGSEYQFAQKMNQKAKLLGTRDSHFVTASGLPAEDQYSSTYDLTQIMLAVERNPFVMNTLATKYLQIRSLGGRGIQLKNHNKMLWRDQREIIGKTGWTRNARHCFVGRIRHGDKAIFISILGSKKAWNDIHLIADRYLNGIGMSSQSSHSGGSSSSQGYNVTKIQQALKRAGFFNREPTGYFGRVTKRAVVRFQKAHGLSADGVVGPQTWAALSRYL